MELTHTFDVPVPPDRAFAVLRDIERIGPCMPGATIDDVDGDHFSGRVKVKIGPIQVTYRGEADYVDVDPEALTATIDARGREARGSGTANATVRAQVVDGPDGGARVNVVTELAITGRPAQFGRGVMVDVGEKLIGRFADCLAETLAEDGAAADPPAAAEADGAAAQAADAAPADAPAPVAASAEEAVAKAEAASAATGTGESSSDGPSGPSAPTPPARRAQAEPEAIDLLEVAGAPVAQRLAPVAIGALVLWLILRAVRRR